ncbi:hypothetical protein JCM24511_03789 [Saitozyma sp. JCM 24511]|nr:hypothetical protein JCM24511_03789 [Saitozyma sp. JCM 24511]
MAPPTVEQLCKMFDNSVLFANATEADMIHGIEETKKYKCGVFVTQPFRVKQAVKLLEGTGIPVQCWVSLPHGLDTTTTKVSIAKQALEEGAGELDMVVNISALKSGDWEYVEQDLRAVVETAKPYNVVVKAIIEVFWLTDEEITKVCKTAVKAGCGFIKTSSGYRVDDPDRIEHAIKLIRAAVGPNIGIKASGATWSLENILRYLKVGATRFGVGPAEKLVEEYKVKLKEGTTGLE